MTRIGVALPAGDDIGDNAVDHFVDRATTDDDRRRTWALLSAFAREHG